MNKLIYLLSTVILTLSILCSCEKPESTDEGDGLTPLQAPELVIASQSAESFTITWRSIPGALYYSCRVNGVDQPSTQQPNLTCEGLEVGTYEVEVRAKAMPDSGYSDSEWSSITVDLTLADDWFVIDDVYLKDDEMFSYWKYNSIYFVFKGYDVQSVKFSVLETSDIEGMSDEDIIDILDQQLTDQGIDALNNIGEIEGGITDLQPETEYVVAAYAVHKSGTDKFIISDPVTTEAVPDRPDDLENWIGSYRVTSTQTLEIFNNNGAVGYNVTDEPMEFDITIEASPNDVFTLYIYGWSILEEQLGMRLPARAKLSDDGGLRMEQGYITAAGYSLTWMPICLRSDGTINILTICDTLLTMYEKDGEITATMYSGSSSGYDFTVLAVDLFMNSGVGVQIPHQVPAYMPAGQFSFERVEGPAATPSYMIFNLN